jgi:hypothetical protein
MPKKNATESIKRSKGTITSHDNSGTGEVAVKIGLGTKI